MPGAVHLSNTCSVPVIVLSSRTVILFNSCRLFLMQLFFYRGEWERSQTGKWSCSFPLFSEKRVLQWQGSFPVSTGPMAAEMEVPDDVSDDCSNDAGTRAASWEGHGCSR